MANSISFGGAKLTEFYVDDDPARVIKLNLTDMGVIARLDDCNASINDIQARFERLSAMSDGDGMIDKMSEIAHEIKEAEAEMRGVINKIFGTDVCTPACGENSSVFDISANGTLMYENILTVLGEIYGDAMKAAVKRREAHVKKHTAKYAKK